jgi:tetratricopeptide (TPR) repeat protein
MRCALLYLFLLFSFLNGYAQLREDLQKCAVECMDSSKFHEAITYFSWMIKLNPADTAAYFDRGILRDHVHDYKGSIEDFTMGIKLDSGNLDNYFLRGIALYRTNEYKMAIVDLSKMLHTEEDNADAYYYRALSNEGLADYPAALLDYTRAIKLKPTAKDYYLRRGELKMKLGKKKEGKVDLTKYDVLNAAPSSSTPNQ